MRNWDRSFSQRESIDREGERERRECGVSLCLFFLVWEFFRLDFSAYIVPIFSLFALFLYLFCYYLIYTRYYNIKVEFHLENKGEGVFDER